MEMPISASPSVIETGNSWSSHIRATLVLGLPLIGAQLAQLGINTTDVMIVGRLGTTELAAMILAGAFWFTIMVFGSGFPIAVIPMIAQAYGRGDVVSVRRSLRMGLWIVTLYWLLMVPVFVKSDVILLAMKQKPDVAKLAHEYLMIAQFGLLPALLYNVIRGLVSAIGRARIILYITIAMLALNAFFAYGLVLGRFGFPALGLPGAAMVAVAVNALGFVFIVFYVQSQAETRRYEIFVRFWRPDWHAFWDVMRLGLPISITILAEVSLFTAASLLMGQIGTVELAAHGIAMQWASIAFMLPLGLSQAATVRIGVAHGRGDHQGLIRAAIVVMAMACLMALFGSLLFALVPKFLASLFLDVKAPDASEVLSFAAPFLVVAGLFQFVDGLQAVANGLLRGLKDARVPMILALIAYWPVGFFLAWLLAFPLGLGGIGIWFGFLVGLTVAAGFLCGRFYLLIKKEGMV